MAKRDMNDLLKRRMSATQQAAEIAVGDEAYETLFQGKPMLAASKFCDLPLKRLCPFFTADIGFHPYPPEKLKAFSQQLAEQGIYERIIVRPIPESEDYEILAGHNRTAAWRLIALRSLHTRRFGADDEGYGVVLGDGAVPENLRERARLAELNCPESAIELDARGIGQVA